MARSGERRIERRALAINLSYVLHEASESNAVQAFQRRLEVRQRQIRRAVSRFERLADSELAARVVVLDHRPASEAGTFADITDIIRVRLGAWALLERVLRVLRVVEQAHETLSFHTLDDCPEHEANRLELFRAPALLCWPPVLDSREFERRTMFASLVLRPGDESLQLELFPGADSSGVHQADDRTATLQAAEFCMRAYLEQWDCCRALWSEPVERARPEFMIVQTR